MIDHWIRFLIDLWKKAKTGAELKLILRVPKKKKLSKSTKYCLFRDANTEYFNAGAYSGPPEMFPIVLTPAWHGISSR
jgi:hypothetical protein